MKNLQLKSGSLVMVKPKVKACRAGFSTSMIKYWGKVLTVKEIYLMSGEVYFCTLVEVEKDGHLLSWDIEFQLVPWTTIK